MVKNVKINAHVHYHLMNDTECTSGDCHVFPRLEEVLQQLGVQRHGVAVGWGNSWIRTIRTDCDVRFRCTISATRVFWNDSTRVTRPSYDLCMNPREPLAALALVCPWCFKWVSCFGRFCEVNQTLYQQSGESWSFETLGPSLACKLARI